MSDALTDIARDTKREGIVARIRRLEKEFVAAPSAEKARELEGLWREYMRVPRGYWGSSDAVRAQERIAFYRDWQPGDERWLAQLLGETDGSVVLRTGWGFVSDMHAVEEVVTRALVKAGGLFDFSVFRVKLAVEAERVTCASCPRFGQPCLMGVTCNSRVEGELALRKARAERGRVLSERGDGERDQGDVG